MNSTYTGLQFITGVIYLHALKQKNFMCSKEQMKSFFATPSIYHQALMLNRSLILL